jgi:acyl carrier protein
MTIKRRWLLSFAQIVLVFLGCAMFLLASGKIPANFGSPVPWGFSLLFFLGTTGCGYFAIRLSDEAEKLSALAHMAGRPALSDAEFCERYFSADRTEMAAGLRRIFARHLPIDLSRMQPDDRFVEDLRMDVFDSLSTVEFVIQVEKAFGIEFPNFAAEKMTTFQDVVDHVAVAVEAKAA